MIRPGAVPAHAEALEIDAVVKVDKKPSRFAPGREQLLPKIKCPACQNEQEHSAHTVRCKCGLFIRVDAAHAYIWRDRMDAKAVVAISASIFLFFAAVAIFWLAGTKQPTAWPLPLPGKDQARFHGVRS